MGIRSRVRNDYDGFSVVHEGGTAYQLRHPNPNDTETQVISFEIDSNAPSPSVATSSIIDVTGNRNGFNPVTHYRTHPIVVHYIVPTYNGQTPVPPYVSWWVNTKVEGIEGVDLFYPLVTSQEYWPRPNLPSVNWSTLVEECGQALSGRMEASTNMLVNVAQMAQTVRMFKNPFGILNPHWRRQVKKMTTAQAMKSAANVWLEYRYGWSNLYRDIKAFASMYDSVSHHMQYMAEVKDKWAPVARSNVETIESPSLSGFPQTSPYSVHSGWEITPCLYTRRATFSFDYLWSRLARTYTRFEYSHQYLGMDKMVEALWDLVPFSFVIDWFIDLSNVNITNPILWNGERIRFPGYSLKEEWYMKVDIHYTIPTYGADHDYWYHSPSQIVGSTYERISGFPPGTSTVGFFGGLNLLHAADSASLIMQRL